MGSTVDLHMHSTASDGKDTPEKLLENIRKAGISCFSLTDHDTITGVREMEALFRSFPNPSIKFIRGIEFSCITPVAKCHILGYGYDWDSKAFEEILGRSASLRRKKLEQRLRFLEEQYSIRFSDDDLAAMRSMESVGKPHMGELIAKMGFSKTTEDAIHDYINKCPTLNTRMPAKDAISAIRAAGGVPVWAHPLGGIGERRLSPEEFRRQLGLLREYGIEGLECHYSAYAIEETRSLAAIAEENGLCISGGSDYHARPHRAPLGKLNTEDQPIDFTMLSISGRLA